SKSPSTTCGPIKFGDIMMKRANFEDLVLDEATNQQTLDEEPFTGIVFELFDNGAVIYEAIFVDGRENGVRKEGNEDGKLLSETAIRNGLREGIHKEYYTNGSIKKSSTYECGFCTWSIEYDLAGRVVKEYQLTPDNPDY